MVSRDEDGQKVDEQHHKAMVFEAISGCLNSQDRFEMSEYTRLKMLI
jgi:hypothetical protein